MNQSRLELPVPPPCEQVHPASGAKAEGVTREIEVTAWLQIKLNSTLFSYRI